MQKPNVVNGSIRECDLNEVTQQMGLVAHRLYRAAEGSTHIYQSLAPINTKRLGSIFAYLGELPPDCYFMTSEALWHDYQDWCMEHYDRSEESNEGRLRHMADPAEFPTYIGSDGAEHGEY